MKNTLSGLKNKVERIKSRLHEAEYQISGLDDKIEKTSQKEEEKEKKNEKEWRDVKGNAG